jgi:hypothetical protein
MLIIISVVVLLCSASAPAAEESRVESRNGLYYAEVRQTGGARAAPDRNAWNASVFTRDGDRAFILSAEIPYDVPFPALYLSDTGEAIVVHTFDGFIDYYDRRGRKTASLRVFGSSEPQLEQIVRCSVAGGRAAFLVSSPLEQNARLFLTDLSGNRLWQKTISEQFAGEVFLSDDAGVVCAGAYSSSEEISHTSLITDAGGSILRTIPILFRHADVSSDNRLFALTERNAVLVGNVYDDLQEPARWTTTARSRIVTSVMFVDGVVAAAVDSVDISDGSPVYRSPELIVIDRSATVLRQEFLTDSSRVPSGLKADNGRIILQSASSLIDIPMEELGLPR